MSEEALAPSTGPDGVRRTTPYLHTWKEEEKLEYATDSNFDSEVFNQQHSAPDHTTFQAENLAQAKYKMDSQKNPNPELLDYKMPPEMKDRLDRQVFTDTDRRQQSRLYEQSRMQTTSVINAPSQVVRYGGPKPATTEAEVHAANEAAYGGQIKVGMSPISEHPVGSMQNPVDVRASQEANRIAQEAARIAQERVDETK